MKGKNHPNNWLMSTIRRQAVTLIELLIVMALLAVVSGVVAIGVNKAIVDQKFRTEVSQVVEQLRLAQDLMLIMNTDVQVHFESDNKEGGITYYLETETNLPPDLQRVINRAKKPLKMIKGIFFRDQLPDEIKEKQIEVKFLSNGAVMSKGIMRLATTDKEDPPEGTLQSYICLPGYPKPIKASETLEDARKLCIEIDKGLDGKLAEDTFSKLPERIKQKEKADEEEKPAETQEKKGNKEKAKGQSENKPQEGKE